MSLAGPRIGNRPSRFAKLFESSAKVNGVNALRKIGEFKSTCDEKRAGVGLPETDTGRTGSPAS